MAILADRRGLEQLVRGGVFGIFAAPTTGYTAMAISAVGVNQCAPASTLLVHPFDELPHGA
jgi:hypothetical protein